MSQELEMTTGQAHELTLGFRRNGWTNADIKQMCEGDLLTRILPVVRGQARIEMVKHLINCVADPIIPQGYGWTVEYHDASLGLLELDPSKIELYLSKQQQVNSYIEGNKLLRKLRGLESKSVLNANVLDDWLADNSRIPEIIRIVYQIQGKLVFFWGTIYRDSDGYLYVRYLRWFVGRWHWYYRWLGYGWFSSDPAAVLESD
ncbi:hypothetical protein A2810_00955 [candidate division Kazan bacterium RIFCSPHIGHO2_01_FULL_49_10]|uniref:Uncharacterized protein n=1 Tax=candidate division Kazan bacterium RIFCSPLOWO2_01_FULL_48_13 TaxID=1798539 RepID=A0A1F4PNX6_UNCK3|nr:MAG: hypothetical protein A2810_00955 [candidate division Kazan bacterium RIFCSPHIGHO2_01_FULL_49_10]OGB85391.1 MAG: hypothetical protein A2994_02070 [candidate division Kazan bacterium RIFCSPLOWO2_01_FULL_48_13]